MVRYQKSDCGKSAIRHRFQELYPSAFSADDRNNVGLNPPSVICLDLLQYIKHIAPMEVEDQVDWDSTERVQSYASAVSYLSGVVLNSVGYAHKIFPEKGDETLHNPLVVIVSMDKYHLTCPARKIVQHKRTKKEHEKPLANGEFLLPALADPLEYPFAQITEDKNENSRVLFQFLAYNIMKTLSSRYFNREMLFVFDGHCIDTDYLYFLDELDNYDAAKTYSTPIMLRVLPHKGGSTWEWLPEFENFTGEGDFLPFFYFLRLEKFSFVTPFDGWENDMCMEIISVDTDSLLYAMEQLEEYRVEKGSDLQVSVMFERIGQKKPPKWCNVNHINDLITQGPGRAAKVGMRRPVLNLITAALAGGSDYTENHYYVPHKHWINAFVEHPDLIGDIVDVSDKEQGHFYHIKLNPAGYVRLVCIAYIKAKEKVKFWQKAIDLKDASNAPAYDFVHRVLVKQYPHSDDYWLPSKQDIKYSANQMQYLLNMISRIGNPTVDIELVDSNLEEYSHEKFETEDGRVKYRRIIHRYTPEEILAIATKVLGKAPSQPKKRAPKNEKGPNKKVKAEIEQVDGIDLSD